MIFQSQTNVKAVYRLHEKISAICLADRSTILAVFVPCFQYLYSLAKSEKNKIRIPEWKNRNVFIKNKLIVNY